MPVTRMQQKRGTAAEWASTNPILADGEIGFERDTGTIKVGNGYDTWANLVPILRSVLAPTEAEWNANTRILGEGEVAIARDTQVIKVGDGTKTWSALPSVLASTFVGTRGGDTITASSATVKPLTIKGAAGQSANLLEVQHSDGNALAVIGPAGGLSLLPQSGIAHNSLFIAHQDVNNAAQIIRLPASQAGNALQVEQAGTTLASISAAGVLRTTALNAFLPAANYLGLLVRGAAAQSASLAEFQNSGGAVVAGFDGAGRLGIDPWKGNAAGQAGTSNATLYVGPVGTGGKGLVVQGLASQSANLAEFQNNAGGVVFAVRADGQLSLIPATHTSASAGGGQATPSNVALFYQVTLTNGSTYKIPMYNV